MGNEAKRIEEIVTESAMFHRVPGRQFYTNCHVCGTRLVGGCNEVYSQYGDIRLVESTFEPAFASPADPPFKYRCRHCATEVGENSDG
jgi:hypothetical protein